MGRIGQREIVIVNNCGLAGPVGENLREINVHHNLGHIGHWIGKTHPRILGWSMSWILPALIAYSEQRDFIYVEQDCLVFGDWESQIIEEAKQYGWNATFGRCPSTIAACEQSLFWLHCQFIPEFVGRYMEIKSGDADMLPEDKFMTLLHALPGVGQFSLPYGRTRPFDPERKSFYIQQVSETELNLLRSSNRI